MKCIFDEAGSGLSCQIAALKRNNISLTELRFVGEKKDVIHATDEIVPAGYGDCKIDRLIKMLDRDTIFTIEPHLMIFEVYAQIDGEEMKHRFHFTDANGAFDMAVESIKKLILANGYTEVGGGFEKAAAI